MVRQVSWLRTLKRALKRQDIRWKSLMSVTRIFIHADSDMVVFATPLYYYGMSAQLKTVVDRFCAYNSSLNSRHLRSALLTVAWNADDWTFDALEAHYKTLVRYINFKDCGMVLGYGCGSPGMTKRSRYPKEAYQLGRSM